ncbi:hypothetical protein, partial [Haloferax sp. Atlit-6N]|uniref:hypothetical protein n=1 Tax=Haloferax sp. Atlit-6N TaxID=2077205 RepID=UPI0011C05494
MIKKAVFAFFILLTCYFGNSALASEAKDQYIVKFKDTSTEAAKNLNIPNRDITYDFSFGHMSVVKLNESDEKKMRNSDKVEYIIKNREVNRIPESKNVYNEDYYLPLPYNMKQIQLNKIGYLGLSGKKVKLA